MGEMINTLTRTISVTVTPAEAARLFACFNSTDQAHFFNSLALHIEAHYPNKIGSWAMQLQYVTDDPALTPAARNVMEIIGEYAKLETCHG